MVLRDVRYCASVWCYATCGTKLTYAATRATSGDGSEPRTRRNGDFEDRYACSLRACYVMPGTDLARGN
eukprot:2304299-Rhodomonas_salina.2